MKMLQLVLDLFGSELAAPAPGSKPYQATDTASPTPAATEPAIALDDALAPAHFAHPRANRAISFAHAHVHYQFRRGQRRTIGFAVGADGLTVSAPRWTPLTEVEAALREKEHWIVTKLDEARARHQRLEATRIDWKEGASLPFLGEPVVLMLDPRQRHGRGGAVLVPDESTLPGAPRMVLHVGLPQTATPEQLRDTVQAWLMRQARRVFTARLDHFAPLLNVRWRKMSLSSAGTRWGSASADGSIRLNWRLIHFRESIIDYVVVHELAHLREMNHSPRFWQHVEAVLPDYAERRGALKEEVVPRW
ncbi:MAG: SprT family zinc-dependent metalloprotease [Pseudomonadota bacterium]|nr:SprT family zinc-dependent metalloprotease [Pseudomonadota bacterium]